MVEDNVIGEKERLSPSGASACPPKDTPLLCAKESKFGGEGEMTIKS